MFSSRKLRLGLLSVGIKIYGKVSSSSGKQIKLLEEIKEVTVGKKKLFSLTIPSCQHFKKVWSLFVNSKTRLKLQTYSKIFISIPQIVNNNIPNNKRKKNYENHRKQTAVWSETILIFSVYICFYKKSMKKT